MSLKLALDIKDFFFDGGKKPKKKQFKMENLQGFCSEVTTAVTLATIAAATATTTRTMPTATGINVERF